MAETGRHRILAVPTNSAALGAFRYHVTCLWRRSLGGAAKRTASRGAGRRSWGTTSSRNPESFIPGRILEHRTQPSGVRVRYGRNAPECGRRRFPLSSESLLYAGIQGLSVLGWSRE